MSAAVHALVPAGGTGERFGGPVPKQFLIVAGRPLLSWTVERLWFSGVASVTVGVPREQLAAAPEIVGSPRARFVAGGASRQETVARCLAASPAEPEDWVLVHDGARAAVAGPDIAAVLGALATGADGAVLGRPVADTLKRVEGGRIWGTIERAGLARAETPQVFRRRLLALALEQAAAGGWQATDESGLVERLGGRQIVLVPARFPNPKLTEPSDLPLLVAALAAGKG